VAELVAASGRSVTEGTGAYTFSAVASLMACVTDNEAVTRRIWPVIIEVCKGHKITQNFINGMFYLEKNMTGDSLSSTRLRKRLVQIGFPRICDSMVQSANYHGGGMGHKNCALGILQAINKGHRNRLSCSIKISDDE
jgi:hypothetical protein